MEMKWERKRNGERQREVIKTVETINGENTWNVKGAEENGKQWDSGVWRKEEEHQDE